MKVTEIETIKMGWCLLVKELKIQIKCNAVILNSVQKFLLIEADRSVAHPPNST